MNLQEKLLNLFNEKHIDETLNESISVLQTLDAVKMALPELRTKVGEEKISTIFDKMIESIEAFFHLKNQSLEIQKDLLQSEIGKYEGSRFDSLPAVQSLKKKLEATIQSQKENEETYKNFKKVKESSYSIIAGDDNIQLAHTPEKSENIEKQANDVQQSVVQDIQKAVDTHPTEDKTPEENVPELDVPELKPEEPKSPEPQKPPKETLTKRLAKGDIEPKPQAVQTKDIDITQFMNDAAKSEWNKLSEEEKNNKKQVLVDRVRRYRKEIITKYGEILRKYSPNINEEIEIEDIFAVMPILKSNFNRLPDEGKKEFESYLQTEIMPRIVNDISNAVIENNIDTKPAAAPIEPAKSVEPTPEPPKPVEPVVEPPKQVEPEPVVEPTPTPEPIIEPPKQVEPEPVVEPPKPSPTPVAGLKKQQQPVSTVELLGQGKAKLVLKKLPNNKYQIVATNPQGKTITVPGEYEQATISAGMNNYKLQLGIPDSEIVKWNTHINPDIQKHAELDAQMKAEREAAKQQKEVEKLAADPKPKKAKRVAGKGKVVDTPEI